VAASSATIGTIYHVSELMIARRSALSFFTFQRISNVGSGSVAHHVC
jgi:hypothetical protein